MGLGCFVGWHDKFTIPANYRLGNWQSTFWAECGCRAWWKHL